MYKKRSFTLIEVMVAVVIFALVIVGLSSVFIAGNKHIIHTRERVASVELGKFFMDPLQVYVRQDTWDSAALNNELRLGTRAGVSQTINNRVFTESHAVSAVAGTNLRRVISTISWTEPTS